MFDSLTLFRDERVNMETVISRSRLNSLRGKILGSLVVCPDDRRALVRTKFAHDACVSE